MGEIINKLNGYYCKISILHENIGYETAFNYLKDIQITKICSQISDILKEGDTVYSSEIEIKEYRNNPHPNRYFHVRFRGKNIGILKFMEETTKWDHVLYSRFDPNLFF